MYVKDVLTISGNCIKRIIFRLNVLGSFEGYTTSPLYFYNNGVWSNLQTTGVTTTIGDATTVYNNFIGIGASLKNAPKPMARLNQTVNISSYSYLKGSLKASGYVYGEKAIIGVSQNPNVTSLSGLTAYAGYCAHGIGTAIVNISSLTGNYYIYLAYDGFAGDHSTTSGNCYEIYLSTT